MSGNGRNDWSLVFAPKSESFLARKVSGKAPEVLKFSVQEPLKEVLDKDGKPDPSKVKKMWARGFLPFVNVPPEQVPVLEAFKAGDKLYSELGGRNDSFCYQAHRRGVEILRIPSWKLKEFADQDVLIDDQTDERKAAKSRPQRVVTILELASEHPEFFYPMLPWDDQVMIISNAIRGYDTIQKRMRIPAQHRIRSLSFDFAWLPEEVAADRMAKIRLLLDRPSEVAYYLELEENFLAIIREVVQGLPIWESFLLPIKGIDASIGARLIELGDIRRFPRRAGFRAYFGLAVVNGKMSRFQRRGEGSETGPKHDPDKRQALYLFGQQIVRQGEGNAYNAAYKEAKAKYELKRPETSSAHRQNMAIRAAFSRFADDYWNKSWRLVEEAGQELPMSVQMTLYPERFAPKK